MTYFDVHLAFIYPNGSDVLSFRRLRFKNDTLYVLSSGSLIKCTPPSIFLHLSLFFVAMACVDRLDNDIFVVFHNWITDEFNILKLPQRYREKFTLFLHTIKEQNVQDLYIENLGSTLAGNPFFRAFGGGFNLYLL